MELGTGRSMQIFGKKGSDAWNDTVSKVMQRNSRQVARPSVFFPAKGTMKP